MSKVDEKAKSMVAAVAPANANGTEGSVSGQINLKLEASQYQGKLRIKVTSSMVPGGFYAQIYQNGFPSDPNTGYVKDCKITKRSQIWDTGLVWGTGYGCALILDTYDSTYKYQYVCKLTT